MLHKTKSAVSDFYSWISDEVKNHIKILKRSPKIYHKYLWLNLCIWKDEIYMRVFGSKTNYELCVKRWEYLWSVHRTIQDSRPDPVTEPEEFEEWIRKLSDVKAEIFFANREADHHRTGCGLSWRKDDLSDEHIADFPEWWFNLNKYKRMRLTQQQKEVDYDY